MRGVETIRPSSSPRATIRSRRARLHDFLDNSSVLQLPTQRRGRGGLAAGTSALPQDVLDKGLAGLVATTDERAAGDVQESHVDGAAAPHLELGGRDVLLDLQVALGGAHVLAEGDDVDAGGAQVAQRGDDLVLLLAEAEHDARLGDDAVAVAVVVSALDRLDVLEHGEALAEGGAAVAHVGREGLDGLDVVRVDVEPAARHERHHVQVAPEVAGQGLDEQARLLGLDAPDGLGEVARAAVGEVVAVDARQHDVAQPPARQGLGGVLGLVRVQRRGRAVRLDAAEAAAARARVAHQHDGRRRGVLVAAAPALRDVGAPRLLAHRVQPQPAQVLLDLLVVVVARGYGRLQPLWQPCDGAAVRRRSDFGCAQGVGIAGR